MKVIYEGYLDHVWCQASIVEAALNHVHNKVQEPLNALRGKWVKVTIEEIKEPVMGQAPVCYAAAGIA
jgi:hypothetical protein